MNAIRGTSEAVSMEGPLPNSASEEVLLFEFDLEGQTRFESVLSPEELSAARRRRDPELRERFVAARGILRTVLASYLDRPAISLEFLQGANGKPFLEDGPAFNLSHSEGSALLALSTVQGMNSTSLGVDVEHVREWPDLDDLARTVFTPVERTWREAHKTGEDRRAAFFRLWTAKESYMKATGEGLSCPLQEFQVQWFEDEALGKVSAVPSGADLGYRVMDLPLGQGRRASLCLAADWKELPIRRFQLR